MPGLIEDVLGKSEADKIFNHSSEHKISQPSQFEAYAPKQHSGIVPAPELVNGKLTVAAAPDVLLELFPKIDANQDHFLSRQEIDQALGRASSQSAVETSALHLLQDHYNTWCSFGAPFASSITRDGIYNFAGLTTRSLTISNSYIHDYAYGGALLGSTIGCSAGLFYGLRSVDSGLNITNQLKYMFTGGVSGSVAGLAVGMGVGAAVYKIWRKHKLETLVKDLDGSERLLKPQSYWEIFSPAAPPPPLTLI